MSPLPPYSFSPSACIFQSLSEGPGPSKQILDNFSALNLTKASSDSIIISVPPHSEAALPVSEVAFSSIDSGGHTLAVPPYNLFLLANRKGKGQAVGGIALDPLVIGPRKLRGRKYELSKAQFKAVIDIADGKQKTFPGVLRVEPPLPLFLDDLPFLQLQRLS